MGEWENRKGGRASADGGYGNSVRDTQTRARETDCGRRRHRPSISCLWILSAVCYSLSFSLFTDPLTSTAQEPCPCLVCLCQFKTPRYDKDPAVTTACYATYEKYNFLIYPYVPF